jgi:hypothetical protein
VTWTPPSARDNINISVFTVSHASGSVFSVGEHLITTFANDTSGNIADSCNFTVTVSLAAVVTAEPAAANTAATSAAAAAGTIGGLVLIVLIVALVFYKRQQRQLQLIEEMYGNRGDMSDEAVLARAQVLCCVCCCDVVHSMTLLAD